MGGAILAKSQQLDPDSGDTVTVIDAVRWTNVALSRTPVNQHLGSASPVPQAVFAKSMNGFMLKALEASTATNHADLTGGGALGVQSLDKGSPMRGYAQFKEQLAAALLDGRAGMQTESGMVKWAMMALGINKHLATIWVRTFIRDAKASLKQKKAR